jgi:hypothetical protein
MYLYYLVLFISSIILPVILYGCETWSLTLRVFENRVLRRIFGPKKDELTGNGENYIGTSKQGNGENYIMRSLVICNPYPILCCW